MKLDVNVLRYLGRDEFRTLTAVEMGQKNHEIVPATLVDTIAGLKHGGAFKCLKTLLRHKLVHHDSQKYDGYRLTTLGYDFLAIRTLVARGTIASVGRQIGVGKEADVFEVADDEGKVMALKLHRLGRTSFRAVKSKRDYVRRGSHFSWLYLSRLAALKEFAFMKALGEAGLPVPQAIDCNRHCVLMALVDGCPLVQVRVLANPRLVYSTCMDALTRLAQLGLVHCDFNEFNLLVSDEEVITLIDFPQMVSTSHPNAKELYDRDVAGVTKYFARKLHYAPDQDEDLEQEWPSFEEAVAQSLGSLDEATRASGFKREHQAALEQYTAGHSEEESDSGEEGEEDDSEEESEKETERGEEEEESSSSEDGSKSDGDLRAERVVEEEGEEGEEVREDSEEESEEEEASGLDAGVAGIALHGSNEAAQDGKEEEEEGTGAASQAAETGTSSGAVGTRGGGGGVAARVSDQRRRAARQAALAKASRNSSKSKNKGKKKGAGGGGAGLDWD